MRTWRGQVEQIQCPSGISCFLFSSVHTRISHSTKFCSPVPLCLFQDTDHSSFPLLTSVLDETHAGCSNFLKQMWEAEITSSVSTAATCDSQGPADICIQPFVQADPGSTFHLSQARYEVLTWKYLSMACSQQD